MIFIDGPHLIRLQRITEFFDFFRLQNNNVLERNRTILFLVLRHRKLRRTVTSTTPGMNLSQRKGGDRSQKKKFSPFGARTFIKCVLDYNIISKQGPAVAH